MMSKPSHGPSPHWVPSDLAILKRIASLIVVGISIFNDSNSGNNTNTGGNSGCLMAQCGCPQPQTLALNLKLQTLDPKPLDRHLHVRANPPPWSFDSRLGNFKSYPSSELKGRINPTTLCYACQNIP